MPHLTEALGCPLSVRLTTGDYRLDDETLADPPPSYGELIVATPERLEAVLRNPDYTPWLHRIGAICVDEAHLLNSPHRGPTLEYLVTSFLCMPTPPRFALLSATIGDSTQAQRWLAPCDLVATTERHPPLRKTVLELASDDDTDTIVVQWVRAALREPETQVIVFVYQTRSAERLAALLQNEHPQEMGDDGALAYHAQMSAAQRVSVRESFQCGRSRCLVTTTALGLGVNLPASHVLVRDTTFARGGPLPIADILQMLGRAGRGASPGEGCVLVRQGDAWNGDELAQALRDEQVPGLVSHLTSSSDTGQHRSDRQEMSRITLATRVAAHLARHSEEGLGAAEIATFFARSLAGQRVSGHLASALDWLTDPLRVLAFRDEHDRYRLTVLGKKATRSVLPLPIAAGFAQLLRDLLTLDPSDQLLQDWQLLDTCIALNLLSDRAPTLRPFSSALANQVDAWMEQTTSQRSLLYRSWIYGQSSMSRAEEVLGSLGLTVPRTGGQRAEWARKTAYLAVFKSIVLLERGQGVACEDVIRRWNVKDLAGVEEQWRDDCLWLLNGLAAILDLRSFYFHLRETCQADTQRVYRVKKALYRLRHQAFDMREQLKYCSPLGSLLMSLRRTRQHTSGANVGVDTIRRLEMSGIRSTADLMHLGVDDLIGYGVRRDLARQIVQHMRQLAQ
jgi:hypothetical protein